MDDLSTEDVVEGFGLMDYDARMYDPQLGRFVQADSIIPLEQGAQAWDRYGYVNNSPVNFTDPSGHIACIKSDLECMTENNETKDAIKEVNNKLASDVEREKISSVEALAKLIQYSESLYPGCTKCLIQNVGAILTGHDTGIFWKRELGKIFDNIYTNKKPSSLGQEGYDPIFKDPYIVKGGNNQAHHFWFYVQVGYQSGKTWSNMGVVAHETIVLSDIKGVSIQDAYLGFEGTNLGIALSNGEISSDEVSNYILYTLSVDSAAAQEYYHYSNNHFPYVFPENMP